MGFVKDLQAFAELYIRGKVSLDYRELFVCDEISNLI